MSEGENGFIIMTMEPLLSISRFNYKTTYSLIIHQGFDEINYSFKALTKIG